MTKPYFRSYIFFFIYADYYTPRILYSSAVWSHNHTVLKITICTLEVQPGSLCKTHPISAYYTYYSLQFSRIVPQSHGLGVFLVFIPIYFTCLQFSHMVPQSQGLGDNNIHLGNSSRLTSAHPPYISICFPC